MNYNGKEFNGLDHCPNCVRGEVLQENLKLQKQNQRYKQALEKIREDIYDVHSISIILEEALEGKLK